MAEADAPGARAFFPAETSLTSLRAAAARCEGCALWTRGTQTVFGEGPAHASLMLVGEQPGDVEDESGRPFVGPAGLLLDRCLARAGIARGETYVTNVVKHFKWEARGKRRIHSKPNAREIRACLPWLEAEMADVEPGLVVCLGATAAQALLGPRFRLTQHRGELQRSPLAGRVLATVHPSALLRAPDEGTRRRETERFVEDLRLAKAALAGAAGA
ncbi:MAG: UdgX family uracil-DNA binding protein [Dehalococcoidia bacterium]|nr:UdgX family uracil-DNA binding protein [Dehalococcoidia bacterium]